MLDHGTVRQHRTIPEDRHSGTDVYRLTGAKGLALVIDDQEVIRDLVSMILFNAGFTVITANGASEGISLYHQQNVDIVITDLHMPDGDGRKVAGAVKGTLPETPVILITGDGYAGSTENNALFDAVVLKPFTSKQLLNTIRSVGLKYRITREE